MIVTTFHVIISFIFAMSQSPSLEAYLTTDFAPAPFEKFWKFVDRKSNKLCVEKLRPLDRDLWHLYFRMGGRAPILKFEIHCWPFPVQYQRGRIIIILVSYTAVWQGCIAKKLLVQNLWVNVNVSETFWKDVEANKTLSPVVWHIDNEYVDLFLKAPWAWLICCQNTF